MPKKARRGQRGHVKAAADNRGAPGVTKARARAAKMKMRAANTNEFGVRGIMRLHCQNK